MTQAAPVAPGERLHVLDVLRGFALMGILLVNIELFRGADLYRGLAGDPRPRSAADEVAQFAIGWLAGGKFLSSFALLFGVGAALMVGRARAAGVSPRRLLARRYAWLTLFGLAHMLLLFAGDILFVYGVAGLLLLMFVSLRPRAAAAWAVAILGCYMLAVLALTASPTLDPAPADGTFVEEFEAFFADRAEATVAAYTTGGLGAQLAARAWEALVIQGAQLFELPWVLALFLLGYAAGGTRLLTAPQAARTTLRRVAAAALPVGLLLNLPLGFEGALGAVPAGPPAERSTLLIVAVPLAQTLGAPLLAVGYLAGLALVFSRRGTLRRLAPLDAAGRMALTGYIAQSVLCTAVFVWLGLYDRLSTASALPVVVGVWALVLAGCSAWLRRFTRGPLELLWRRLTYGRGARPAAGARSIS